MICEFVKLLYLIDQRLLRTVCKSNVFSEFGCSFDADDCEEYIDQVQTDIFDWKRHTGATLSRQTGPSYDHTTGKDGKQSILCKITVHTVCNKSFFYQYIK